MHWTVGHLAFPGANIDLIMGAWGDGTVASDRFVVSLLRRVQPDGSFPVMVIDADERAKRLENLAASGLLRSQVIGSPLALFVFSIIDAIDVQDDRLSMLNDAVNRRT